jgi:hypothetical protein
LLEFSRGADRDSEEIFGEDDDRKEEDGGKGAGGLEERNGLGSIFLFFKNSHKSEEAS